MGNKKIYLRFYGPLNDFLKNILREKEFVYEFFVAGSIKDAIESFGVPHTEVFFLTVNNEPADFNKKYHDGDMIAVYPKFFSLPIKRNTCVKRDDWYPPRFILDVHLGKLCKKLRMLGIDTLYKNNFTDEQILVQSLNDNRIILTRDIELLKNNKAIHGYFIRSINSKKQIQELINYFELTAYIYPFTRCIVCNGILHKIEKDTIKANIPSGTYNQFDDYYQCSSCKKIFWKGSHYMDMKKMISDINFW